MEQNHPNTLVLHTEHGLQTIHIPKNKICTRVLILPYELLCVKVNLDGNMLVNTPLHATMMATVNYTLYGARFSWT